MFSKAITLDRASIQRIEEVMIDFNINNFSQGVRTCVQQSKAYESLKDCRDNLQKQIDTLNKMNDEYIATINGNIHLFKEIKAILKSKKSQKQKIEKLKGMLHK